MRTKKSILDWAWPVENRNFSVLFFSDQVVCAGRFLRKKESRWQLVRSASAPVDEQDPSLAWKSVLKSIGGGAQTLLLTGVLHGGVAFSFLSAKLSPRDQRGAVEMELPRRVFQVPEDPQFQFAVSPADPEGRVSVLVYLFPAHSLNPLAARMSQSGCRADGFVYPFLTMEKGDPALYLPGVEADFSCQDGQWSPVTDRKTEEEETEKAWKPLLEKMLILPEETDFSLFLPLLLVARMFAGGHFARNRIPLTMLPEKLRSLRFRKVMIASIILLLLLVCGFLRHSGSGWLAGYRNYRQIVSETRDLQSRINTGKRNAKRNAREQKERQKVFDGGAGNPDAVAELAILSAALPANVLVSSIRWNDGKIDLTLQSENENLDLPTIINPLHRWKVEQIQQRQRGDSSVANLSLTLVPLSQGGKP